MSVILHIESATDLCSVCLSQDGGVITYEKSDPAAGDKAAVCLAPMIKDAISMADSHALPLDAVALSAGPGSYTGLRIATSLAKGVCYGRNLPLISVSTLELLCVRPLLYCDEMPDEALLCPMLDARRMEVYTALYTRALRPVRKPYALVVEKDSLTDVLAERPVYFFGPGAEKCEEILAHPNATFLKSVVPEAKFMLPLAERAIAREEYADVAYFEPFYLKDFVATVSKKIEKVLHT